MAGVATINSFSAYAPQFGMQAVPARSESPESHEAPAAKKHAHGHAHGDTFVGHRDTGVDLKDLPLGRRLCSKMILWYQNNKTTHGGPLTFHCTYPQKARQFGRDIPSCSQYTLEAIQKHGVLKGILLGSGRIMNCNPISQRIGFLKDRFLEA